ncbi:MAG TPA: homoserine kinase [Longimicrobiales bacterium]|nr:homoserine kinase [Longimicrobiales bacterium]
MIRVTVPCSTSNLGAGFDCIGLAFNRYLHVEFTPGNDAVRVTRIGTLENVGDDQTDIIATLLREHSIFGNLHLDSNIPVGKGLGSSAAATVAALAIISAVAHEELDVNAALHRATSLEGHPDNSAPSLIGGLVAVVGDAGKLRPLALHLSEDIGFAFAAPHVVVGTKAARQALPDSVPHPIAARTIARSIALVEGLAEGDPDLLRIGFMDDLHVPFRLGMIPGGANAVTAAVSAGAWAATISGSGSGIIAVCPRGDEGKVAAAMEQVFVNATSQAAIAFAVAPDFSGMQVEEE